MKPTKQTYEQAAKYKTITLHTANGTTAVCFAPGKPAPIAAATWQNGHLWHLIKSDFIHLEPNAQGVAMWRTDDPPTPPRRQERPRRFDFVPMVPKIGDLISINKCSILTNNHCN